MPDGSIWEVGTFALSGTGAWSTRSFTSAFAHAPAVFLTAQTASGSQPVTVKARNVTATGFQAALFEEEGLMDGHVTETVGYLAVYSPFASGTVGVNDTPTPYLLQSPKVNQSLSPVGYATIKLEEEQSRDAETTHPDETVAVLLLGKQVFAQISSDTDPDTVALRHLVPEYAEPLEWGVVDGVDQSWRTVPLAKGYSQPVVIAQPVSSKGADPGVVRLRAVQPDSFALRYQEWDYLDGMHSNGEQVFYLVAEAGSRTLAGLTLHAGTIDTSKVVGQGWTSLNYPAAYISPPAVWTSVQTDNDPAAVTTRIRNVTATGFQTALQEQEANALGHGTETVGWIAIELGAGKTTDNRQIATFSAATSTAATVPYGRTYNRRQPVLVGDMVTTNGSDPCTLRFQSVGPSAATLYLAEEASQDTETAHANPETLALFGAE
jgi:hypothetical protein